MNTVTSGTTSKAETLPVPRQRLHSGRPDVTDAGESAIRRGAGVVGLVAVALIHLLDLPGKLSETPYLGVMYIGLMISALIVAEALIRSDRIVVWAAAGLLAASAMGGYSLTRTVGLPGAMGDIGNWLEPLGLASLFVEGVVILLAVIAIRRSRPRSDA